MFTLSSGCKDIVHEHLRLWQRTQFLSSPDPVRLTSVVNRSSLFLKLLTEYSDFCWLFILCNIFILKKWISKTNQLYAHNWAQESIHLFLIFKIYFCLKIFTFFSSCVLFIQPFLLSVVVRGVLFKTFNNCAG